MPKISTPLGRAGVSRSAVKAGRRFPFIFTRSTDSTTTSTAAATTTTTQPPTTTTTTTAPPTTSTTAAGTTTTAGGSSHYQQTDTAASLGVIQACSASVVGVTNVARKIQKGAAAGVGVPTTLQTASGTRSVVMFGTDANDPGLTSWPAGNYIVRLNVTTANTMISWVATYVCRVDSGGNVVATVGSLTDQSVSLGTTGVKSMTVSGALQSANAGDRLYIVLVFQNSNEHSGAGIGFMPDQLIDTPL